jgi:hypothetical protein
VMILIDGLIVDRVAVSVAVSSSIMLTRVGEYRTAAVRGRRSCPTAARSSYRTEGGNTRRNSSLPRTSRAGRSISI